MITDTGWLYYIASPGDPATCCYCLNGHASHSPETRARMRAAKIGNQNARKHPRQEAACGRQA